MSDEIAKLVERLQTRISSEHGYPDRLLVEVRDALSKVAAKAKPWDEKLRQMHDHQKARAEAAESANATLTARVGEMERLIYFVDGYIDKLSPAELASGLRNHPTFRRARTALDKSK